LQSQWYHANTFLPLKEENFYSNSKNDPEMAGPKVSIKRGFTLLGTIHICPVVAAIVTEICARLSPNWDPK